VKVGINLIERSSRWIARESLENLDYVSLSKGIVMTNNHDWLTLHRVKFSEEIDGNGNPMPGPADAQFWRFAPQSPTGPDGLRTNISDIWGGFGLYKSKAEAEAVFNDPKAHLPFLDRTAEAWHSIVVPYAHRGAVQWREMVEEDSAIKVAPVDPKGPLVVMTTAGHADPAPEDTDRMKAFIAGIDEVIDFYGSLPDNLRRGIFAAGAVDGLEGCTMTLWRNDKAMMGAAYKNGVHKEQLARHQHSALFDRSSFTRGRVVASRGTWDGVDPMAELGENTR